LMKCYRCPSLMFLLFILDTVLLHGHGLGDHVNCWDLVSIVVFYLRIVQFNCCGLGIAVVIIL